MSPFMHEAGRGEGLGRQPMCPWTCPREAHLPWKKCFHWVIESGCPSVCVFVCLRHQMQFISRPLIGHEITWSVPGLSLVDPPLPFFLFPNIFFIEKNHATTKKNSHFFFKSRNLSKKRNTYNFFSSFFLLFLLKKIQHPLYFFVCQSPLGLVVAKSVCLCVVCLSPSHAIFF